MIQSHLIDYVINGRQFLIFDTVSNGKHVFTACGEGRIKKKEPLLTATARETLAALSDYVQETPGRVRTIRFQEIATVPAAPVRIQKAIEGAADKDIIFYVCRSPHVYDAAIRVLNARYQHTEPPQ